MIGGIISGAANLIQGAADRRQQTKNIQDQKNANRELAQYGYGMDLEQWKRQNAYNTPLSQMERFKEAGLNQNLIYGQGTSGNASGSPTFNEATTDHMGKKAMQFSGALPAYNQQMQNNLDLKQKEANIYKTEQEGDNEMRHGVLQGYENALKHQEANTRWNLDKEYRQSMKNTMDMQMAKLRAQNTANQNAKLDLEVKQFQHNARKQGLTPQDFMYVYGMTGITEGKLARTALTGKIGGAVVKGAAQLYGAGKFGKALRGKPKKAVKKPTWAQENKWSRDLPNY